MPWLGQGAVHAAPPAAAMSEAVLAVWPNCIVSICSETPAA